MSDEEVMGAAINAAYSAFCRQMEEWPDPETVRDRVIGFVSRMLQCDPADVVAVDYSDGCLRSVTVRVRGSIECVMVEAKL